MHIQYKYKYTVNIILYTGIGTNGGDTATVKTNYCVGPFNIHVTYEYPGREITAGGSPVKVTGPLNFSSDIPNFWPVKLFSLKQSLVKYTPKNVTIFPV